MHRRLFGLGLIVLGLGACETGPSISSDVTPGANFANYRTYEWVDVRPAAGMNPVALERMRQGIEQAMVAKGYTAASPGDISVILTVAGKDRVDVQQWGRFGQNIDTYRYTEGTLSVDAFDTRTAQALWHGRARQNIDPGRVDPATIDEAVAGVMAQFPSRR